MTKLLSYSFITISITFTVFNNACSTKNNTFKTPVTNSAVTASNDVEKNYTNYCAGCHGEKLDAFVDRKWKFGNSRENIFTGIKNGYPNAGMPAYKKAFSDQQIYDLTDFILKGIKNRVRYDFGDNTKQNVFISEEQNIQLDTIARGFKIPWSIAFLPNEELLVTEKNGGLYKITNNRTKIPIENSPEVVADGQGGLMDIILHPNFKENNLIYISYSKRNENNESLTTTAIMMARLAGNKLENNKIIFEALPYSTTRHHYGGKMVFANDGLLYFSVGERGNEKQNPQSTSNDLGKIHRIKDDGSIPADNPFSNAGGKKSSLYTYGNRNPQGLALNPFTNQIWEHEHGPRGGDEINIILPGKNYGWPAISYGINYDGTVLTKNTALPGMEQPLHYWVPSIAPSGMAFVTGNKYKGWQGTLLVGSLKFKYLNKCTIKNNKVISEELLLKNIGRLRDVRMGPDGFIYIAVENPGYVFKLLPVDK